MLVALSSKDLPKVYCDFSDIFSEESTSILPANNKYNHHIELESEKRLLFSPLYNLLESKLKVL